MKKKLLLRFRFLFFLLLLVSSSRAQIYFGISGGYGFPLAKQVIAVDYTLGSSGTYAFGGLQGSFGKGYTSGFFVGYNFNDHWSGEVSFERLSSSKIKSLVIDTVIPNEKHTIERMARAKLSNIIPSVRYTIGEGKFKTYIRTGLLIGFNGKITSEATMTNEYYYGSDSSEITEIFRGGVSLGFLGGVGVNYSLNNRIVFFAEAVMHAQTWSPLKSSITKYTGNGVDHLNSMSTSFTEREYKEKSTSNFPGQSPDSPSILLKRSYPFSSYGLTLGIVFKFNN